MFKKKICFGGKLIKNTNLQILIGIDRGLAYVIEKNTKNEIKGMQEIDFMNCLYIGQGENLYPQGKGKVIITDEIKISGYFEKGWLQGIGKIKGKDFISSCNFVDGLPQGDFYFTYQNVEGNFFVDYPSILLKVNLRMKQKLETTKQKLETMGQLLNKIISKMLFFKNICSKENPFLDSCLKNLISNFSLFGNIIEINKHNINSDFKLNKTWKEYENKASFLFGIERIVIDKKVYIGDTPKGKGKILFDDGEKYKGETVNGIIHGFGKYWYKDGSLYIGEFVKGKKHGIGMMIYGDKYYYKGYWKDDRMYGKGFWKKGNNEFSVFNTIKGSASDNFVGIFKENLR
ncbi:hypothetical protein SteCoe_38859 [Stentor coeruleus]|uniref:MORN repeat protein n=1 Tax=Stentor coeruleus TaxID=5963 RepID=A0A1R2AL84_9CILI|nr:hypothetical protein SteCoe_38859 [Stentor coeruleus]